MSRRPISAAYLERKLRAVVGVQGSNPLPDLGDVHGLITLELDRPEWLLPGGEHLGWGRETQGVVAAQFQYTALSNPANSGVIAILQAVQNLGAVTGDLFVNYNTVTSPLPGVGGSSSGRPRDTRDGSTLACLTVFGSSAAGPFGDGPGWAVGTGSVAGQFEVDYGPWILAPGSAIILRNTAQAQVATGVWHWRERPVEGEVEIK